MEKLMFTMGLTDMVSKPAASINKTILGMKENATGGFDAIRGGAIGLAGAGLAIKGFMDPVYDMQRAMGEVKSLDVAEKELKQLQKTALGFSVQYGESAADFVRSSYDIQSAIGGLENGELAAFTKASNVLAKGTKADAATITNYMGTMYGIFADQANAMGKAQWVEQLTGQTAAAVQMFKTTGAEMSGAFTSLGANGQAAGIQLSEQMAILGTLQATMSGSEAGTKYKAFLAGVGTAQEKLGLTFTDSQGRMLPMLDILGKLKGKFGDTLDVAEGDALKKAFGSDEAVSLVKQLMGQTDGLSKSIAKINTIQGMDNAAKMAQTMVDPWEQFGAVTEALRISFGTQLLPTINDLISRMNSGLTTVMGWTEEFPNITRWVGLLTLGILAMSAATGVFSILLGLGKTALAAWGVMVLLGKGVVLGLAFGMKLLSGIMAVFKGIMFVVGLATNTALAPMWLVVAVIGGLIAGVGWLIYKIGDWLGWWDKLTDYMGNTQWGQAILDLFGDIGAAIHSALEWLGLADTVDATATITKTTNTVASGEPSLLSESNELPTLTALKKPEGNGAAAESIAALVKGAGNQFNGITIQSDNPFSPADLEDWAALQAM